MRHMTHALFPGTFDPPTLGHLDVVLRALELFEQVTIGLADHASKTPLFSVDERLALLTELAEPYPAVSVARIDGLVVDAARNLGASVLVRGVRNSRDFDYEVEMAQTNRVLTNEVTTVFVLPEPAHANISSTLVRQIAQLGGDTSQLVPACVNAALRTRFPKSD
ncbi:MAG: pantetheine-phosphate adenylyltransferase [Planctomycetota bacterium]|jgi:pantetheine-phosphate adenylyltransferase